MNRTDRLTGIILALQRGRRTAAQLAERFEVSRRTILRDIDALCEIGVPIISLPGSGGGLELHDDHWLKPVQLTDIEATALLLAARGLGSHPNAPLSSAAQSAVDKLRGVLGPDVITAADRDLAAIAVEAPRHAHRLRHFAAIREAIERGSWVEIEYQSLRRVAMHTIQPRSLSEVDGFWHCHAISLEARAQRQYRLDRIVALRPVPVPSDAEAIYREALAPRPPYHDPSHPEVVARLTYQGLRMAEDLPRLEADVQQIAPEKWEMRFRCPPGELPYFARAFLGFGPETEIVAPAEMRQMIRSLALATAELHAGEGDETVSPSVR